MRVAWFGSIDGSYEALGCVIYCFLVKFTNEKELVSDRPTDQQTDRPTDKPSYRDARMHLKTISGCRMSATS